MKTVTYQEELRMTQELLEMAEDMLDAVHARLPMHQRGTYILDMHQRLTRLEELYTAYAMTGKRQLHK